MIPNFEQGNCRNADTELFFPQGSDISGMRKVIRDYCLHCPIARECLEWALEMEAGLGHSARSGIYGATTPRMRHAIHKARRDGQPPQPKPINHGTAGGYRTHLRRNSVPCGPCITANRDASARRRRDGDAA